MSKEPLEDLPAHWREKITAERIPRCPVPGDCWTWTGCRNKAYGKVADGMHTKQIHRAVYERLIGEIPAALELDHLCCNTFCCNPDHLEAVTRAVNMRRAMLRRRGWTWTDIRADERIRKTEEESLTAAMSRPSPTGLSPNSRFRRTLHKRAMLELQKRDR